MFLWTLQTLFGIFVCDVVTAQACGFLNITRQTNGGILDIKITLWNKRNIYCVTGSLVSANIRKSKVSDLIYCFSDFRDQSTLLLAVCNVLSAERDVLT